MLGEINVIYLLIMVAVAVVILAVLRMGQRAVLRELADVLYRQNNPGKYLNMLESGRLKIVLRRGTIALLRLDGYSYAGDKARFEAAAAVLGTMKQRPEERLSFYRKGLDFAVLCSDAAQAEEYLGRLDQLLAREQDPKLCDILADAHLLVGVHIRYDLSLIPRLEALATEQQGHQKGITCYRLANLYHVAGDDVSSERSLEQAGELLKSTAWQDLIDRARSDGIFL